MVEKLPRRTLGNAGVCVTALGLGGAPVGVERVSDAQADEVAKCVVFLSSKDAGFITGATLNANGGQYMV